MMKRIIGLLLFLVSSLALAVPAAYVHQLQGEASATTKGVSRVLKVGSLLELGDEVYVSKGTATLKFEDGQIVALMERSRFSIVKYHYNKAKVADSNVVLSLLAGGMRYITGVIGGTRRDAIALRIGTATIGIRGTDIILFVDPSGQVLATVQDGAVVFTNQGVAAALSAGQGSTAGANQPPLTGRPVGQLAPGIVGAVGNLGQQNMPANNPISVTASADLVRAVADASDKARRLAEARRAAAAALTDADKARAAQELAAAKAAAEAAAADAAQKVAAEAQAALLARQTSLQGGAATDAGTSPPSDGQGPGLLPLPLTTDPAFIIETPAGASGDTDGTEPSEPIVAPTTPTQTVGPSSPS